MMLGEAITLESGLVIFAAMLALTFFSLNLARRARRRVADSRQQARAEFERLRGRPAAPDATGELMVQLEDLSRRITAQVDTRFAKLEVVAREADERIASLKALLARADRIEDAPADDEQPPAAAQPPPPTRPVRPTLTRDERVRRVHELADRGVAPIKIAEEVAMPLGEVELLLNLRQF